MLAFAEEREGERRVHPDVSESTLSTVGGTGLEVMEIEYAANIQTTYIRKEPPFPLGKARIRFFGSLF